MTPDTRLKYQKRVRESRRICGRENEKKNRIEKILFYYYYHQSLLLMYYQAYPINSTVSAKPNSCMRVHVVDLLAVTTHHLMVYFFISSLQCTS